MLKSAQIWKGLLHHRREQWVMEPEPKPDCWVLGSIQVTELVCFPNFISQRFFFWYGPFLKSLLNLLQYYFCFMFWYFGLEAHGILTSWLGIEPTHPALEGEALTTRPPRKSPCFPNFRRTVLAMENPQYDLWFLKESNQFSSSLLVNLSHFERWSWTNTQDCQLM